jgi:hypothetical protein
MMVSKIKSLAIRYEVESLDKYASQLSEAVDSFDIAKIQKLMDEFETRVIKDLK